MVTATDTQQHQAVSCPWCGSPAAQPCTTSNGAPAQGPHVTRIIDAGRWHDLPPERLAGGMWDDSDRMTRQRQADAYWDAKTRAA